MRINLTAKQVQMLAPYFDKVRATRHTGYPGMLVAQIRYNEQDGSHWMEPGWLEHHVAKRIEERGQEVTKS